MSIEETTKRKEEHGPMWFTIMLFINLHCLGLYGIWLTLVAAKWMTVFFAIFILVIAFIGVTVGAHRYYAHRTFVASTPLRIFFVVGHTLAGVGSIHNWVLLHRMHHKYYKTDNDPYNHNKGFIYSHFLSNFSNKYLEDTNLVKSIDMRDIESDGYAWFQHKFYFLWFIFITLLFPINIPTAYWNESVVVSLFVLGSLRLAITSNMSWLVNSAFLFWSLKPTDKNPVEDFSVFYVEKSLWPNYHYLFPRDWKSSEYGFYGKGFGTLVIKFFYEMGLISMLMTLSSEDVGDTLYKIASKKKTVKESLEELEQISEEKALREKLRFHP